MRRLLLGSAVLVMVAAGAAACGTSDQAQAVSKQQCATARPLPAGQTERTIVSGGVERSYVMYVPKGYEPTERAPVAVMFHGLGGDPDTVLKATDMIKQADERNAILVVPLGRGKVAEWQFRSPITDPSFRPGIRPRPRQGDQARRLRRLVAGLRGRLLQRLGPDPGPGLRRLDEVRGLCGGGWPLLRAALCQGPARLDHLLPRHR
ncbi:hypothetical protein [Aeromicrobium sp. UC242_57]|uniref:hypothetical protein n=1 Tax=Aeromicrobium sp. UC242_57 TaxID=3374624 RepID=UPI00378DCFD4